jgi:hypothetical protein
MRHHEPIFHPIPHANHELPFSFPSIPKNHTTPINSPYWPSSLHLNVEPQPYISLNPLDHAHVGTFPLSTLLAPIVAHD